MLKRIYVHNYKAFQNFELKFDDFGSSLFLGKNGSGKSSLVEVFKIFQKIGENTAQLSELIHKDDFNIIQPHIPIKLELEVEICNETIIYELLLEFPQNFDICRVKEEKLIVNNIDILNRSLGDVFYKTKDNKEIADFFLDWHMLALPIFNPRKQELDSVNKFKEWLSNIVILSPIPDNMTQRIDGNANKPDSNAENISSWITTLFSKKPRSYQYIDEFLKPIFPDLEEISTEDKELRFIFKTENKQVIFKLSQLSSGERIFVLWSAILASVKLGQISLCVWDEPENYVSIIEIQQYFMTLHHNFYKTAQFIATTHNPETMRIFATDDIFILKKENHLQPIRLFPASEENIDDCDIVDAIKMGLIEL